MILAGRARFAPVVKLTVSPLRLRGFGQDNDTQSTGREALTALSVGVADLR